MYLQLCLHSKLYIYKYISMPHTKSHIFEHGKALHYTKKIKKEFLEIMFMIIYGFPIVK